MNLKRDGAPSLEWLCEEINATAEEASAFVEHVNTKSSLAMLSKDERWNEERMEILNAMLRRYEALNNLLAEIYGPDAAPEVDTGVRGAPEFSQ